MVRVTSRGKPGLFIMTTCAESRPRSRPAGNWRGIIRTLSAPRAPSLFTLLADGCICQEKGKYSFSQEQNGAPTWQLSLQINHFSTARFTAGLRRVVNAAHEWQRRLLTGRFVGVLGQMCLTQSAFLDFLSDKIISWLHQHVRSNFHATRDTCNIFIYALTWWLSTSVRSWKSEKLHICQLKNGFKNVKYKPKLSGLLIWNLIHWRDSDDQLWKCRISLQIWILSVWYCQICVLNRRDRLPLLCFNVFCSHTAEEFYN